LLENLLALPVSVARSEIRKDCATKFWEELGYGEDYPYRDEEGTEQYPTKGTP
jgi:hypothetical protein